MRQRRRIKANETLPAIYSVGGARGEGRIGDLSHLGLFLQSPLLPPEGERVVISFTTPEEAEIVVQGTVQWNTGKAVPAGFGVRLSSCGRDYVAFVNDLLHAKTDRDTDKGDARS